MKKKIIKAIEKILNTPEGDRLTCTEFGKPIKEEKDKEDEMRKWYPIARW